MSRSPYSREVHDEVVAAVKGGMPASTAAEKYPPSESTINKWVSDEVSTSATDGRMWRGREAGPYSLARVVILADSHNELV